MTFMKDIRRYMPWSRERKKESILLRLYAYAETGSPLTEERREYLHTREFLVAQLIDVLTDMMKFEEVFGHAGEAYRLQLRIENEKLLFSVIRRAIATDKDIQL